jgi:hypothetical protein
VGFALENSVMEASQADDMASVVRRQLAPVFTATLTRHHTLFLKARLPVDSKPKDPTAAARTKLKELGELMINQDPTTLFYKYKQTHKDEKDACNKLSQLPTTITGIQAFMNGFLPSPEGGDVWGNLRIGINSDPTEFIENVAQEARMRKFWIRKAPLQAADTDYAGWLYLSIESMHPEDPADSANLFMLSQCTPLSSPSQSFMADDTPSEDWHDRETAAQSVTPPETSAALTHDGG